MMELSALLLLATLAVGVLLWLWRIARLQHRLRRAYLRAVDPMPHRHQLVGQLINRLGETDSPVNENLVALSSALARAKQQFPLSTSKGLPLRDEVVEIAAAELDLSVAIDRLATQLNSAQVPTDHTLVDKVSAKNELSDPVQKPRADLNDLFGQLATTGNQLIFSRRAYNDTAERYNRRCNHWLIRHAARFTGFRSAVLFDPRSSNPEHAVDLSLAQELST